MCLRLNSNDNLLKTRQFTVAQKEAKYEEQKRICVKFQKKFEFNEMEGDHITPWSKGGVAVRDNLQMRCDAMLAIERRARSSLLNEMYK